MKPPQLKIEKIQRLAEILVKKTLLIIFLLFIFSLILGIFIFYQSYFLIQKKAIQPKEEIPFFEEKIYQEILEIWQKKEKNFSEANLREYPNLFQSRR